MRAQAMALLVPLRHAAWGGNQNNVLIAGYGYGTPFTQPCLYHGMDCLAVAQYLSRIGLLLGGTEALSSAKQQWMDSEIWQPLRRLVEDTLVIRDPFEAFVAQNVAIDGLLYPLVFDAVVDGIWAQNGGAAISMLAQFITDWSAEERKWVDSVIKIAAAESAQNAAVIAEWANAWNRRAATALLAPVAAALGSQADALVAQAVETLNARLAKAGVTL